MKKNIVLVILFLSVFLCACSPTITVTFETNGGSLIDDIVINKSLELTLPDDPVKEGYTFAGWYLDNDTFEVEFVDSIIDTNITLYAKWIEDEAQGSEMKTIDFELILGRMDYGVDTYIEAIITTFAEWSELGAVTNLPELNDKFNEQFFENKALIVFALRCATEGAQFEKVEVFGQGNELLVKVFDDGNGFRDVESNWIVVIEIQQSLMSGFTNLRLETNFYSFSD